jgi:hypothetical protein
VLPAERVVGDDRVRFAEMRVTRSAR